MSGSQRDSSSRIKHIPGIYFVVENRIIFFLLLCPVQVSYVYEYARTMWVLAVCGLLSFFLRRGEACKYHVLRDSTLNGKEPPRSCPACILRPQSFRSSLNMEVLPSSGSEESCRSPCPRGGRRSGWGSRCFRMPLWLWPR